MVRWRRPSARTLSRAGEVRGLHHDRRVNEATEINVESTAASSAGGRRPFCLRRCSSWCTSARTRRCRRRASAPSGALRSADGRAVALVRGARSCRCRSGGHRVPGDRPRRSRTREPFCCRSPRSLRGFARLARRRAGLDPQRVPAVRGRARRQHGALRLPSAYPSRARSPSRHDARRRRSRTSCFPGSRWPTSSCRRTGPSSRGKNGVNFPTASRPTGSLDRRGGTEGRRPRVHGLWLPRIAPRRLSSASYLAQRSASLRVVHHNYPRIPAATRQARHVSRTRRAANCAGEQGKFWEMDSWLFEHAPRRTKVDPTCAAAGRSGLTLPKFQPACRATRHSTRAKRSRSRPSLPRRRYAVASHRRRSGRSAVTSSRRIEDPRRLVAERSALLHERSYDRRTCPPAARDSRAGHRSCETGTLLLAPKGKHRFVRSPKRTLRMTVAKAPARPPGLPMALRQACTRKKRSTASTGSFARSARAPRPACTKPST